MAWAYRASSYGNNGLGVALASGATTTVTLGAAVSAGDLLTLHITAFNNTDTAVITFGTVSDSVNGNWGAADQTVTQSILGLTQRQSVYSFPNSGAGTPVITVSQTNANGRACNVGLECAAFSGIVTTAPKDVSVVATGTSATPSSGAVAATAAANELVVGCYGDYGENDTITEGATFTLAGKHASDAGRWEGLMEYKDSGSSGSTPSADVTLSATNTGWSMFAVVYKVTAGAAQIPPGLGPVVGEQLSVSSALAATMR